MNDFKKEENNADKQNINETKIVEYNYLKPKKVLFRLKYIPFPPVSTHISLGTKIGDAFKKALKESGVNDPVYPEHFRYSNSFGVYEHNQPCLYEQYEISFNCKINFNLKR